MAETVKCNKDEYYLDDDMFDGNDEQIDGLKERLEAYRDAAQQVVACWEGGDLAAAVRSLSALTCDTIDAPAERFGTCDACGCLTGDEIKGLPDGREICRACFEAGVG